MKASYRGSVALLGAVILAVTPMACSRKGSGSKSPASGHENPADVPHPSPPQPTGPQIAGRDSLVNHFRAKLEPWAAMWAQAQPAFTLDSTWFVARRAWSPIDVAGFEPPTKETDEDVTFDILGISSPDGRHTLNVDSYQLIEPMGDTLEVGGEPDSRCTLIDKRAAREAVLGICGTSGGYHWGAWMTPNSFAIGAWVDADDNGQWKQARLSIYSIPDSTVSEYQTRIVSESDFSRYLRAWRGWLMTRYRALKANHAV